MSLWYLLGAHDSHKGPESIQEMLLLLPEALLQHLAPLPKHITQDTALLVWGGDGKYVVCMPLFLHTSSQPMVDIANLSWWPFLKSPNVASKCSKTVLQISTTYQISCGVDRW